MSESQDLDGGEGGIGFGRLLFVALYSTIQAVVQTFYGLDQGAFQLLDEGFKIELLERLRSGKINVFGIARAFIAQGEQYPALHDHVGF